MSSHVFLLYLLLVSNVVFRVLTNRLGLLPKAFNIFDIVLTVAIFLLALRYAGSAIRSRRTLCFGGLLLVFNLILAAGALFNPNFIYTKPALSQVIMWNEPLLLCLAIQWLPFKEKDFEGYRRLLVRLLILQLVLGVLQVPVFLVTAQTEDIIGTFHGNAEQFQGFIMIAVFYLMARQQLEPEKNRKFWQAIGGILFLILLIDNKASWLCVLVSILFVMQVQGRGGALWFLRPTYLIPLCLLFGLGGYLAIQFSPSTEKLKGLRDVITSGQWSSIGKIKAYDDILNAFGKQGQMALVGSGPGNFYTRSGRQFYMVGERFDSLKGDYGTTIGDRKSNALGSLIDTGADRVPFYEQFYLDREIFRVGSEQVDSPFSSFAGLLGETGLVGSLFYLGIYLRGTRRIWSAVRELEHARPDFYPVAVATAGFLAYVVSGSIYNNWMETGRMTTILWSLVGLTVKAYAELNPLSSEDSETEAAWEESSESESAILNETRV